jgi:hypothetical protein
LRAELDAAKSEAEQQTRQKTTRAALTAMAEGEPAPAPPHCYPVNSGQQYAPDQGEGFGVAR